MIRTFVRDALAAVPAIDSRFRRHVWSRIHFPEAELKALDDLPAGAIDCAIDVGAALGGYAWVLGRKAQRVLCYEPGQVHGDYLQSAIGSGHITLVRAAVGAQPGELDMFTPGADTDARHMATLSRDNPVIDTPGTSVRRVPVVTLDADVPARIGANARVDVLKVDVEGFENAVFEGARTIIALHHPLVIAEIESRHNPRHGDVFALLEGMGYQVHYWLNGRYHRMVGHDIAALQTAEDLAERLRPGHDPAQNRYINNFVFQHPETRIKLA
jgi:FkbM family methyltransferase